MNDAPDLTFVWFTVLISYIAHAVDHICNHNAALLAEHERRMLDFDAWDYDAPLAERMSELNHEIGLEIELSEMK